MEETSRTCGPDRQMQAGDAYRSVLARQHSQNEAYLAEFARDLATRGTERDEAPRQVEDVRRFLNEYLLNEDDCSLDMGCYLVDDYFAEFFVRNQAELSADAVVRSAASLERFYGLMLEHSHVDEDAYEELCATIEAQLDSWKDTCARALANGTSRKGDAARQETVQSLMLALLHVTGGDDALERQALQSLRDAGMVTIDDAGRARPTVQGALRAQTSLLGWGLLNA